MNKKLFNEWAESYNQSVIESDNSNKYPFSGYRKIQEIIYTKIHEQGGKKVLEMGIGTGEMVKQLYKEDYQITGVDFSIQMIYKAKTIMPNNRYILKEFRPALFEVVNEKFDVIIFSYSIHHLPYDEQMNLVAELHNFLEDNGKIIIGDVMSETTVQMMNIREENIDIWDDEEFYPLLQMYTGLSSIFDIEYQQVSFCSGIMTLSKK